MRKPLSLGARSLAVWCRRYGARAALARRVGVTSASITRWCDGVCLPDAARRAILADACAIPAETWDVPARRARAAVAS